MKRYLVLLLGAAAVVLGTTQINGVRDFLTYTDWFRIAAPGNPVAGKLRVFANASTGKLACLDATGADCMPSAAAGGGKWINFQIAYCYAVGGSALSSITSNQLGAFCGLGTAIDAGGSAAYLRMFGPHTIMLVAQMPPGTPTTADVYITVANESNDPHTMSADAACVTTGSGKNITPTFGAAITSATMATGTDWQKVSFPSVPLTGCAALDTVLIRLNYDSFTNYGDLLSAGAQIN